MLRKYWLVAVILMLLGGLEGDLLNYVAGGRCTANLYLSYISIGRCIS